MKILVVGSGGREHALAWRLTEADGHDVHAAPGNPGVAEIATCHALGTEDPAELVGLARSLAVDLVVVGPEAPLVAGLADSLTEAGIACFGPTAAAARIEGSKSFAKDVMQAAGVATAASLDHAIAPCVIKADGLAAGKGVFVCTTQAEAEEGLAAARSLGQQVVIEEHLVGDEVSVFALCDGERAVALPAARDYKRIGDGDTGPNTGGMGSVSPAGVLADDEVEQVLEQVHRPVLAELARRGTPFRGLLYAGLMLTASGLRVLEFNCRFGDPETQSLMPRLDGDLGAALAAAAQGDLAGVRIEPRQTAAVTVVVASAGYPTHTETGAPISGISSARDTGALVFHAGTTVQGTQLVAAGGRVLGITGTGPTVADARESAYDALERIEMPGRQARRDIAADAVPAISAR